MKINYKKVAVSICILSAFLFAPNGQAQTAEYYDSGNDKTPDMGMQGDFHTKNVGKIVFAKEKIDPKTKGSDIISNFTVGDNIYGMVYLQTCVMNYKLFKGKSPKPHKNELGGVQVWVYIDNVKQEYVLFNVKVSGEQSGRTYLGMPLNGKGDDSEYNNEGFINSLNGLSNGSHTVKFELWGWYVEESAFGLKPAEYWTKSPIASGEFTINKGANSKVKLGHSWASLEAKMTDADIEKRALEALKANAKAEGWMEAFSKIKITDEDWDILHNTNTGVIVARQIVCAAYAKWPDGHCTYQKFAFIQDYNGAGYQKTLKYYGVVQSSQEKIDCDE